MLLEEGPKVAAIAPALIPVPGGLQLWRAPFSVTVLRRRRNSSGRGLGAGMNSDVMRSNDT